MRTPLIIVITGNIASGKSTALKTLQDRGEQTLSADAIVHELLAQKEMQSEIRRHFASPPSQSDWISQVRDALFSDDKFREWYVPWMHRHVSDHIVEKIRLWAAQKYKRAFVDIPLFFESKQLHFKPDYVWLIYTPKEIRYERWRNRPSASLDVLKKMERWQIPDEEKFKKVDIILNNGLGTSELSEQITQALKKVS